MNLEEQYPGGRWVTMRGHHVYVKADGSIAPETAPKLPDAWKRDNYAKDVEHVPISFLKQIREWDRRTEPRNSPEENDALRDDIAVHGIRAPLIINYDPKNGHALLGEGNHRLAILEELGQTHAPVRVARNPIIGDNPRARKLSGAVLVTDTYVRSELRPSDVFYDFQNITISGADATPYVENMQRVAEEQLGAVRTARTVDYGVVDELLDSLFGKSLDEPPDRISEPDAPHTAGRHEHVIGATEAAGDAERVEVPGTRLPSKIKIDDESVLELIRSQRWGLNAVDVSTDRFRHLGGYVGRGADLGSKGETYRLSIWPKRTPEMQIEETVANAEFAKDSIWYDSRIANVRIDGIRLKPHTGYSPHVPSADGLIWRGICYEEMQTIRKFGYVQSKGEYNDPDQGILTYFAERIDVAAEYAGKSAPYQRMPTFERYSYIIGIRRPDPVRIDEANSPPGEVAIKEHIDSSEIVAVYEVRPFAIWQGYVDLVRTFDGMKGEFVYRQSERKSPNMLLAYRKWTNKEVGSLSSDLEKSITDEMAKKYPGGHWVTMRGHRVYIKADGQMAPETDPTKGSTGAKGSKKPPAKAEKATEPAKNPSTKAAKTAARNPQALMEKFVTSGLPDKAKKHFTAVEPGEYSTLVATGKKGEGYFVMGDGSGQVDTETYRNVLKDAKKAGIKPPFHIYGKYELLQSPNVSFHSTQNMAKKPTEKPTETTSQPAKGAKKAPAKAEPAKPAEKAPPKGSKKPPAKVVEEPTKPAKETKQAPAKTKAAKTETKPAKPEPAAKKPTKSRLERLADRRGETVDTVGTDKPKIDERGRRKKAEYQDVGQKVGGARKDVAAQFLDSRSVDDLKALEGHDATQAYEAIKRDNLWEKFDAQKEMDNGVSPGAAFLKKGIVAAIAKGPQKLKFSRSGYKGEDDNSPQARENYLRATNLLQDLFSKAKTAQNVIDGITDIIRRANNTVSVPHIKPEDFPNYPAFNQARADAYKEANKDRYALIESLHSLGATFFNRYMRAGDTWREHRHTARGYDEKGDWSWSEAKAKAATGGDAKTAKPKWERQVPTEVVRKGGTKKPPATKAADFMNVFGMRGVEFGNWVDDDEAKYHVEQASLAFADFSDITGIPMKDLSLNGRLAMAFGARGKGKASAHYEPGKKVINMTKFNGGGSLAHEWSHALDNILSMTSYPDSAGMTDSNFTGGKIGPLADPKVKAAFEEVKKAISQGDGKYTVDVDADTKPEKRYSVNHILVRNGWNIDAALADAKKSYPGTKPKVLEDIGKQFVQHMRQNGHMPPKSFSVPTGMSQYVTTSMGMGEYYGRSEELFARAFESFIEDKLVENRRYSSYLVAGTALGEGATTGLFGEPWPYPLGNERKAINAAMQKLVDAVRDTNALKKSLDILERREVFRHVITVPKPTVERFFHVVDVENPDLVKGLKASDLTGGKWVTINGNHVYVKGGKIIAGPKALRDLSLKDAKAKAAGGATKAAKPPAKAKTGTGASKTASGRGKKVAEADEKPVKGTKKPSAKGESLPKSKKAANPEPAKAEKKPITEAFDRFKKVDAKEPIADVKERERQEAEKAGSELKPGQRVKTPNGLGVVNKVEGGKVHVDHYSNGQVWKTVPYSPENVAAYDHAKMLAETVLKQQEAKAADGSVINAGDYVTVDGVKGPVKVERVSTLRGDRVTVTFPNGKTDDIHTSHVQTKTEPPKPKAERKPAAQRKPKDTPIPSDWKSAHEGGFLVVKRDGKGVVSKVRDVPARDLFLFGGSVKSAVSWLKDEKKAVRLVDHTGKVIGGSPSWPVEDD